MGRYSNSKILLNDKGKRYFGTIIYPQIEPQQSDLYIITNQGDRLDILAYEFFNDATLWWVIASTNELPQDSIYPPSGTQLRIIQNVSEFLSKFEQLNKSR